MNRYVEPVNLGITWRATNASWGSWIIVKPRKPNLNAASAATILF